MQMAGAKWHFELKPHSGGATADAFRNTLSGQGIPKADLFIREAVQNSVDAALDPSATVRIRISERELCGTELASFLEGLQLTSGQGPGARQNLLSTDDSRRSVADEIDGGLKILTIEDFNTKGLTGRVVPGPDDPEDRFRKLCLELGSTAPPTQDRGGTYGFGKSVYWVTSSMWTAVLYSRFTPPFGKSDSRLFGVSWFRSHTFPEQSDRVEDQFTGRAFFGTGEEGAPYPVTGDAAHRLARELGFRPRECDETGVSIAILGCDMSPLELREGVEKWWWPRLLNGRLEVEIEDRSGTVHLPQPRSRDALGRYVRAWDLLHGRVSPGENDGVPNPLSYKSVPLGRYAITADGADQESAYPDAEGADRLLNAMIRSPGMVVEYRRGPHRSAGHPMCAGVFIADRNMDVELAKSEPPAHNRWDFDSTRQERPLDDEARDRIKRLYEKVLACGRRFLREHREDPPEAPDRCRELEKFLGRFLSFDEGPPPPPPPGEDPFEIRFVDAPARVPTGGTVRLEATVAVSLDPEFEQGELSVRLTAGLTTVQDRGGPGVRLPMTDMRLAGSDVWTRPPVSSRTHTYGDIVLQPGARIVVALASQPLPHAEYRADLDFTVEEIATKNDS